MMEKNPRMLAATLALYPTIIARDPRISSAITKLVHKAGKGIPMEPTKSTTTWNSNNFVMPADKNNDANKPLAIRFNELFKFD